MRLNLTSQISLEQVEERLYKPRNKYEETMLTSYERIPTRIYPSDEQASVELALRIAQDIKSHQDKQQTFALGISGGISPLPVLRELIKLHKKGELSSKASTSSRSMSFTPYLMTTRGF